MEHVAKLSKKKTDDLNPIMFRCSCGTAGDFPEQQSAEAYMRLHESHLSGIATLRPEYGEGVTAPEPPKEEPPVEPVEPPVESPTEPHDYDEDPVEPETPPAKAEESKPEEVKEKKETLGDA